jgi:hypothetical protein
MSGLTEEVRRRADSCCEYCRMPQAAFRRPFHIEHIVAKQHGGPTELANLALACWYCNLKKGPNLTGVDPDTAEVVPLFHPRKDKWTDHFSVRAGSLNPRTIEIVAFTPGDGARARFERRNEASAPARTMERRTVRSSRLGIHLEVRPPTLSVLGNSKSRTGPTSAPWSGPGSGP